MASLSHKIPGLQEIYIKTLGQKCFVKILDGRRKQLVGRATSKNLVRPYMRGTHICNNIYFRLCWNFKMFFARSSHSYDCLPYFAYYVSS